MKKILSLLVCVLLVVSLAAPALADVIWEPEDSFYFSHMDECERVESGYEAQKEAVIQRSPQDKQSEGSVSEGDTVFVYYTWRGWGYVESWDAGQSAGWVDLGSFRRLYNAGDFMLDHGAEITDETGEVSRAENETIYLWSFPGSGQVDNSIESAVFDWAEEDPRYDEVWTDADGHAWGRIGYYYGCRGWVFLDDPGADDLTAFMPRYADEEPTPAESAGPSVPILVIVLVAAVVIVTAVVIVVLVGKKRK